MKATKPFLAGILSIFIFGAPIYAADSTNQPPEVKLVCPPDGAVFPESSDILILAAARDPDDSVQTVEFFADGNSLGVVTNPPTMLEAGATVSGTVNAGDLANAQIMGDAFLDLIPINPFHLTWRDVPAGRHTLTAVATDNLGASTTSAPVTIIVLGFTPPSIVTVMATDPTASEADANTATFTIYRTGPTNSDLAVNYQLRGTASNGVDYLELPSTVTIPAGKRAADVVVAPIDDSLVEGPETVVLRLGPPPCPDPTSPSDDCYLVGRYDRAWAIIRDNDQTNRSPVVRIFNPQYGEIFRAGANLRITAGAYDFDGAVQSVEFFEGTNSLGVVTTPAPIMVWEDDPTFHPVSWLPFYSLTWSNVPAGDYVLTAVATDDQGAGTISGPVKIKVVETHPPPVVTIVATDPDATELNPLSASPVIDIATFTVWRTGDTASNLTVYYLIGGTAQNGVDYQELPHKVTIPAGASSADIVVTPIDDQLVEGDESVVLTLIPPPCVAIFPPPAECYVVGDPGRAGAVIHDNEPAPANQPPMVRLNSPQDGQIFLAPADVHLVAYAQDREDGYHLKVEFFEGTNSLGFGEFVPTKCAAPYCPNFALTWSNVPPGEYTLTAVATDTAGASTRTAPAHIKVVSAPQIPVVTIFAQDPFATEQSPLVGAAPDTATFVVHRSGGDLDSPLAVHYRIGGTASNGVDYQTLSGEIVIPAQSETAEIVVNPIDDDLVEDTETVVLKLLPGYPPCLFDEPPCLIPVPLFPDYYVGFPGEAVAFIRDNEPPPANQPPMVRLNVPQDGQIFVAPTEVHLVAYAQDREDGYHLKVEFFEGTNSLGFGAFVPSLCPAPYCPNFALTWSNPPPGVYTLTAKATDRQGASSVSEPVLITVSTGSVSNASLAVRIALPTNGSLFAAGAAIGIDVQAGESYSNGVPTLAEIFDGTNKIAEGTFVDIGPKYPCDSNSCPPNIGEFFFRWTNAPVGLHTLRARATDDHGASAISDPVVIAVTITNLPVVTIFAKDPFASEQSPLVDAAPDTATFVVHRSGGDLSSPLTVLYRISGTASNGVDYDQLPDRPGLVTIPANAETAEIVVNPIDDDLVEGTETVVLSLLPGYPPCLFAVPPCEIPCCPDPTYLIGFPSEAVAFIRDNDEQNHLPLVEIVKPQTGDTFPAPSDIEIDVKTQDPDGWVHSVEFFANGVKIGEQSIEFIVAPPPNQVQTFSLIWSNVTTGRYSLTAKATDDRGAASWSAPVTIAVGDVPPLVPVVSIFATDPFAAERVSTNGTNTATFRIFRTGPTNLDLAVFYSVHGTASNGVDYAEIGNMVTIPAGRHSARVIIAPIDDDLEEGIETVILKLEPDPSLGPVARYEIGRPDKAAAIIADDDLHLPPNLRLADGSFHLCVERPNGFAFRLEASADLSTWVSLGTYVVTDGALQFVDPEAPEHGHRFYRIVPQSNYVPEE